MRKLFSTLGKSKKNITKRQGILSTTDNSFSLEIKNGLFHTCSEVRCDNSLKVFYDIKALTLLPWRWAWLECISIHSLLHYGICSKAKSQNFLSSSWQDNVVVFCINWPTGRFRGIIQLKFLVFVNSASGCQGSSINYVIHVSRIFDPPPPKK